MNKAFLNMIRNEDEAMPAGFIVDETKSIPFMVYQTNKKKVFKRYASIIKKPKSRTIPYMQGDCSASPVHRYDISCSHFQRDAGVLLHRMVEIIKQLIMGAHDSFFIKGIVVSI